MNNAQLSIQFLGAAGTVTGSKYLVKTPSKTILVDCGLFQGLKELRLLNWMALPIEASEIDLVLFTHGHLDHVGYLPKLVNDGFKGKIYGTSPTLEVASIILTDSARIQEEDAHLANEKGYSKHKPAKPLYNLKEAEKAISLFEPQELNAWIAIDKDIQCRFNYNSHILGATFIELKIKNKIVVFSGDIGRDDDPLMYAPHKPLVADVLLMESTYGNRLHAKNANEQLAAVLTKAAQTKSTVIIPSFAVERTQLLMYLLWQLRKNNKIPELPMYMDSPMGVNILHLFQKNLSWHKLTANDCKEMCSAIKVIESVEETLSLAASPKGKIIIAGSGMATGGKVLTYFERYVADPMAVIILAGYQAEGTRGRRLLDGEKEIKLHGKIIQVKAEIVNISGLSSHADQSGLINWMSAVKNKPEKLFIVHGEKEGAEGLKEKIRSTYGWDAEIAVLNQTYTLNYDAQEKTPSI